MFPPVFPIYIEALIPLHRPAPAIWLSGVVCLWLTRYTHQLGRRWGSRFYVFSAVIRPVGILLIAVGWLALYAPDTGHPLPRIVSIGWLPTGNWTDFLCWLAITLFAGFGGWAVVVLGLRRSFLFRRVDDDLITRGPYALVRHPQFLSAIGITFFSVRLYNPAGFATLGYGGYSHSLDANWALLSVALWVLSILEDRELGAHFGEAYKEYAQRVPRLFPS